MIQGFYDLMGITEPTLIDNIIAVSTSGVLIFFGTLALFNFLLNIVGGIFRKE